MTTFLGRRIISAALAAVVTISGPFAIVTTAAAEPASSSSFRPLQTVARPSAGAHATPRAREAFGKLPLSFEANQGQTHPDVKFLSRGASYSLFLGATEAVFVLRPPAAKAEATAQPGVLRMQLVGSNPDPLVRGLEERPGKAHYVIGADRTRWRTAVPLYGKVRYQEVYPGIDLVYYGNQRQLEYDFIVAPGADPKSIKLAFAGADALDIDAQGHVVLKTPAGDVRFKKPSLYQMVDGVKRPIAGSYVVDPESRVGFRVGAYDTSKPLVIDPVLLYSTVFGGMFKDEGVGIAVDPLGNAYVTGVTESTDFPMGTGTTTDLGAGPTDIFVAKLDPSGSMLVYFTYLGGSGAEGAFGGGFSTAGIAVDAAGHAYVTGTTTSFADFPGPPMGTVTKWGPGGNGSDNDIFVTKLSPSGSEIVYSVLLGGTKEERLPGIALDTSGKAYVVFQTNSTDLDTTNNAYDRICSTVGDCADRDAFVAKVELDSGGAATVSYATYLGGSGQETNLGPSLAARANGEVYVAGRTSSADFPTTPGAYDTILDGGDDVFLVKLNTAPTTCTPVPAKGVNCDESLVYSTFLGGSDAEAPNKVHLALDAAGHVYLTGTTASADFPMGLLDPIPGTSCPGIFVVKINPDLSNADPDLSTPDVDEHDLVYATCGAGTGKSIAVDSPGKTVYLDTRMLKIDPADPGFNQLFFYPADFAGFDMALDASCNAYATTSTVADDVLVQKIGTGGPLAYISNLSAGTVSVIHVPTHTAVDVDTTTAAVDPIPLGTLNPEGVAVHPNGTKAYVTNVFSSSVSVIDTATNTVTKTITLLGSVGLQPVGVAVHPSGRWVFVANSVVDTGKAKHVISVIDTTTDALLDLDPVTDGIQQIELTPPTTLTPSLTQADVPFGIAVHPNGTRLYVTNNKFPGFLTVIDFTFDPNDLNALPGYAFVKTVPLGNGPAGVAVSPDGDWVYVAQGNGILAVISATGDSQKVLDQPVGGRLFGVAADPTARKVYVTVTNPIVDPDPVDPVDTLTVLEWTEAQPLPMLASVITPVPVGKVPRGVAVTPSGGLVYVANFGSNTVSVITAAVDPPAVVDTIPVGAGPVALGQFIGLPPFDKDGDGIQDLVDGFIDENGNFVDQSNVASVNFTNRHLCGTSSGSITGVPAGMVAGVASPAGIFVGAMGGDGTEFVTINLCGFDVLYNTNEVSVVGPCSSLTTQVLSGPIDIVLPPSAGMVTVPTGVTVRVAQLGPGTFEVQNLGGPAAITVDFAGHVILVAPGRSKTVSGAQLVLDACSCGGPSTGGAWKNHGAYVSCIAKEADRAAKSGLITHKEKGAIQSQAARSSCGGK